MFSSDDISNLFRINYMALQVNVKGISHYESAIMPKPGGNCLNWVVGHIVISRAIILEMVGQKPVMSDIQAAPYKRGVIPSESDMLFPFDKLLERLKDSQDRLTTGLEGLTVEQLYESDPDNETEWRRQPMVDQLVFLQFHEAYHVGQTGLLRRLIGKEGAIQ